MSTALQNTGEGTQTMKSIFDALMLLVTFAASVIFSVGLGLDWIYIGAALCGSAGGAVVLAYFRRDPRKVEQFFKTISASVSGLVLGAAAQTYLNIWTPQYVLALFFCSSFLSLVLLRAALNLSEKHAGDLIKDAVRRVFNVQINDKERFSERRRKRRQREPDSVESNRKKEKDENE